MRDAQVGAGFEESMEERKVLEKRLEAQLDLLNRGEATLIEAKIEDDD